MIRVALTGNIASGKSTVQNILQSHGYKVLDTDIVGHECLEQLKNPISNLFKGFDILDENKNISREKLGKIVFSNKALKKDFENIVHPAIKNRISEYFKQNAQEDFVFAGIPLLFETGMQDLFDKIILVYSGNELREERLVARNNYSREYAQLRMNSQINQDEKVQLSDYVIMNNGSLEELTRSTVEVLEKLEERI